MRNSRNGVIVLLDIIDLEKYEIFDLTHNMYHRMPGWPGNSEFTIEDHNIINIDGSAIKKVSLNTHHGTHMDVEAHMVDGGKTLEMYPLTSFFGRGVVLDVSSSKPASAIELSMVKKYASVIKENEVILLHTGWDRFRGHSSKYYYEWPYVGLELAKFFSEKKVKMVGTDGLSIGGWSGETPLHKRVTDTSVEVHRILLQSGIVILEEMSNMDKVLDGEEYAEVFFMAFPLSLDGSDGSPVRAVAFRERKCK